ncbi:uncharacterized protein LOC135845404 [Planococcus citri]|uniref:uncharacterized protein LOC135845404 n=1 Tax=Planococcus citri TaxID=170843 RepID=UPI0031F98E67
MSKMNNHTSAKHLILYDDPASLQQLSAVTVTAELWRTQIVSKEAALRPLRKTLPPLTSCIPGIEPKYEVEIKKYVESVRQSLMFWLPLHFSRAFLAHEYEYDVLKKYFGLICWLPDGSIHYERTAKAFIECQNPQLSIMCKYRLACMYCFEDDIQELYPKLPKIYHELKSIFYKCNTFLRYWDCRMAISQPKSTGSMEIELFNKLDPKTWSAWSYCWSRLSTNQKKIEQAVDLIEKKVAMQPYVKLLLPMLNNNQLMTVLKRCVKILFAVLANTPDNVKYALQTWHYVKDFVPFNIYVKIFEDTLTSNLDVNPTQVLSVCENFKWHNFIDMNHLMNVNVASLLYDIWLDSPDRLKDYLIQNSADEILKRLSRVDNLFTVKAMCRDLRLMLDILSRRSCLENGPFWRKHWPNVVKGAKPSELGEAMKLCFKNDKEIVKFKQTHMTSYRKIHLYCNMLAYQGCFEKLDSYLTFCTSDRTIVVELKKKILQDTKTLIKFCLFSGQNSEIMLVFDDFISDIYPDTGSRRKFKCQLITELNNFKYLQTWVSYGEFARIKDLVCLFLTRHSDLEIVKQNFIEQCRGILSKGEFRLFDRRNWNEFLCWCLNDDPQQLDKFKKLIPIKDVFYIVFLECVKKAESHLTDSLFSRSDCISVVKKCKEKGSVDDSNKEKKTDAETDADADVVSKDTDDDFKEMLKEIVLDEYAYVDDVMDDFERLDNFLLWYFDDKSKADEFKAVRIKKRKVLRKVSDHKNDNLMKVVLHWAFNRNLQMIDAFKVPV